MARYRMEDNTVVDTDNSTKHWFEDTHFDGRNMISNATGSQWHHETLYRSRKGRYYVEHDSNYQGSTSHAEWVSPQEAVRWLIINNHEIPDDLKQYEEQVTE